MENEFDKLPESTINSTLIYDINKIPNGMSLEDLISLYADEKIVLYDSNNIGNIPYVTNECDAMVIDINSDDGKIIINGK